MADHQTNSLNLASYTVGATLTEEVHAQVVHNSVELPTADMAKLQRDARDAARTNQGHLLNLLQDEIDFEADKSQDPHGDDMAAHSVVELSATVGDDQQISDAIWRVTNDKGQKIEIHATADVDGQNDTIPGSGKLTVTNQTTHQTVVIDHDHDSVTAAAILQASERPVGGQVSNDENRLDAILANQALGEAGMGQVPTPDTDVHQAAPNADTDKKPETALATIDGVKEEQTAPALQGGKSNTPASPAVAPPASAALPAAAPAAAVQTTPIEATHAPVQETAHLDALTHETTGHAMDTLPAASAQPAANWHLVSEDPKAQQVEQQFGERGTANDRDIRLNKLMAKLGFPGQGDAPQGAKSTTPQLTQEQKIEKAEAYYKVADTHGEVSTALLSHMMNDAELGSLAAPITPGKTGQASVQGRS